MNNAVQLHNRVPNFLLNKINESTVLSYHCRCTVCCYREYFLHISPPFFKMLSEGVKYIFSSSSAVHRFLATQLFMHLTVTVISSYNRKRRITVQQKNFFSWYLEKFYLFLGIFWPLNSNLLSVFPHHVRFLRYQDTHFYFFS